MSNTVPHRFKTITEFHQFRGLHKPDHPLISVINVEDIKQLNSFEPTSIILDFYCVALKRNFNGKMKYGQQQYDYDEGILTFVSPGQVFSIEVNKNEALRHTGWILYFHPDFLWQSALAKNIKTYAYFDYSVHEALFLSDKEEALIIGILKQIAQEYHSNIDRFSDDVIIAHLELLFRYADRFYNRQFITRKISNHKILEQLETILHNYFNSDDLIHKGLPTVQHIAGELHVSPNYLSSLLKVLTGQSTQQHIHDKLIDKAKEKLSTTGLSVSEIAYELGFEHSQSFSKLFKSRTNVSPMTFRESFN